MSTLGNPNRNKHLLQVGKTCTQATTWCQTRLHGPEVGHFGVGRSVGFDSAGVFDIVGRACQAAALAKRCSVPFEDLHGRHGD